MTNTVLVFALGVFAALDVLFAVRAVVGQRELRALQTQANQAQVGMVQLQQLRALVVDVQEYSKRTPSPELNRILSELEAKPATR